MQGSSLVPSLLTRRAPRKETGYEASRVPSRKWVGRNSKKNFASVTNFMWVWPSHTHPLLSTTFGVH